LKQLGEVDRSISSADSVCVQIVSAMADAAALPQQEQLEVLQNERCSGRFLVFCDDNVVTKTSQDQQRCEESCRLFYNAPSQYPVVSLVSIDPFEVRELSR